jgi:hypothetical protein
MCVQACAAGIARGIKKIISRTFSKSRNEGRGFLSSLLRYDKIVGFHDVTRLTTLRNSAMLDPSHPDTKARCAAMLYLSYLSSLRVRNLNPSHAGGTKIEN